MQTPTLREIRERMLADLDYRLPAAQSRPAKSVLGVLTTVMSGAINSLYGFGQWITEQLDPMSCSEHWLSIWSERLQVPRKAATPSRGVLFFTGGEEVIPKGTRVRHTATGQAFITDHDGHAGEAIALSAEIPGQAGNLATGEVLELETPITSIDINVTITAGDFSAGADEESLSDWRIRVAERLSERQRIGDADDYARWAKSSHPDILDALTVGNYPYLGVITIWVLGSPTHPVISQAVLDTAQITLDQTRNQGCIVKLSAAQAESVNIKIADVVEDVQEAIETDIIELFKTRAKFGAQLWPEEIERLILLHTDQFTMLAPVTKIAAKPYEILTFGGVEWL